MVEIVLRKHEPVQNGDGVVEALRFAGLHELLDLGNHEPYVLRAFLGKQADEGLNGMLADSA